METIDLVATEIKPEKKRLKIAVYGISKNEEKFVARWAQSAKEADLILLADTGSDDRTVEIAKENGVEVHHIYINPWRFDTARNASMVLLPKDIDVCISLDVDEVLEPGWREEIERLWVPGETTRLRYKFEWGAGKTFYHVKIHAREGHYWRHCCHEIPVTDGRVPEKFAFTEKLMITHHPDHGKSRAQYYDILRIAVEEDPHDVRNNFYWARELSYYSKWDEALVALKRYLDMPGATWVAERAYAYITMAKCYGALSNPVEEEKALLTAAMEAPNTREPWGALADLFYRQGRWEECHAAAMRSVRITYRAWDYTENPRDWGWFPHDLAAISAFRLGLKERAIEQGKIACEMEPNDERLKNNLKFYMGEV
jgi:glycosyltransferase involved in cell wall biosynthesis